MDPAKAEAAAEAAKPDHQWAVVQTGFVGADSVAVTFRDSKQRVCPAIVKLCKSEAEARRWLKILNRRHMKVEWFLDTEWHTTMPIYGVARTDLKVVKGKPRGAKPPSPNGPPQVTPTQPAKAGVQKK